jgi:hypothetical protein
MICDDGDDDDDDDDDDDVVAALCLCGGCHDIVCGSVQEKAT